MHAENNFCLVLLTGAGFTSRAVIGGIAEIVEIGSAYTSRAVTGGNGLS